MMAQRLLFLLAAVPAAVLCHTRFERPLHFVFAHEGGKALPYNDSFLLQHFDQVTSGITALVPFLLNVADPDRYTPMIMEVHKRNISIVPGVGKTPEDGKIDDKKFRDIAKGYKKHSDHIRLEGLQEHFNQFGKDPIQRMIDYCISIGFKHIMLNPWPVQKNGKAVEICNKEVNADFRQVLLDKNNTIHEPIPKSTNWHPNQQQIAAVRAYRPNVTVLVNYENRPQQQVLAQIEKDKTGASLAAMQITLDQINGQYKSENLHWIPPWTKTYDAVALGTFSWIAGQLSNIN